MAITPNTNEAFLREVDDELRRDQMLSVWRRYGRWIIGGVVAALVLFAAYLFWQSQREKAAGAEGERLQAAYDALGAGNTQAAATPLGELATSGRPGYAALARFTQGDIQLQKHDDKGAAATFAAIAADAATARPFRDLALIRETAAEYDALKPQVVIDRLRPLAVAGNPWFGSAGELVAVAYLRSGRRDLAATMFGQMAKDEGVPDSIRQRAVQMAGVLAAGAGPATKGNTAR